MKNVSIKFWKNLFQKIAFLGKVCRSMQKHRYIYIYILIKHFFYKYNRFTALVTNRSSVCLFSKKIYIYKLYLCMFIFNLKLWLRTTVFYFLLLVFFILKVLTKINKYTSNFKKHV